MYILYSYRCVNLKCKKIFGLLTAVFVQILICVILQVGTSVSEEHALTLKMERVCSSETLVSTYKFTML
jgi:hypothetical protein